MKQQKLQWISVLSLAALIGCRCRPTPEPIATSAPTASPIKEVTAQPATATPFESPIPAPPTATVARPTAPQALPREGAILRAIYGDALRGDRIEGWRLGEAIVPWVATTVEGHFTAATGREIAALVGGQALMSGEKAEGTDYLEIRWIVLRADEGGQAWAPMGRSTPVGRNLAAHEVDWRVMELTDFDEDGRQEILVAERPPIEGLDMVQAHLMRWSDDRLAHVWRDVIYEDTSELPTAPNRHILEKEIRFDEDAERPTLIVEGESRHLAPDAAESTEPDAIVSREAIRQRYIWDGETFVQVVEGGPTTTFAIADSTGLWLWQDGQVLPLSERQTDEVAWSPDGRYLAFEVWWPADQQGVWLYDRQEDETRLLAATEAGVHVLVWAPQGHTLAYALTYPGMVYIHDLDSESQRSIDVAAEALSWSPDGAWLAASQQGDLVLHDATSGEARTLIEAARTEDGRVLTGTFRAAWSPRGDLIATVVASRRSEHVILVPTTVETPTQARSLARSAPALDGERARLFWAPDGGHLAVSAATISEGPPNALYLLDVPEETPTDAVGFSSETTEPLLRAGGLEQLVSRPGWSPDGGTLVAVVGTEVRSWQAASEGETIYTFAMVADAGSIVEWAPDGSGFLITYGDRLTWFSKERPGTPELLIQHLGLSGIAFAE